MILHTSDCIYYKLISANLSPMKGTVSEHHACIRTSLFAGCGFVVVLSVVVLVSCH